ncbi:type II secretion system F family protein [uncultured Jatrophihabitans sp.]|uniref:type II secretion system F family protein n=1 Tax=uncultured Jatrophihabitans sp. TaxID=1610747 RepID=UPI0035CC7B6B
MTANAWALVAVALLATLTPRAAPARMTALGSRGRLAVGRAGRSSTHGARRRVMSGRVMSITVVGATAVAVGSTLGVVLAAAGAALAALAARLAADVVLRRRARGQHDAVLAAVRILTAELAAGSLPARALAAAATAAPRVRAVFEQAADEAGRGDPSSVLEADPRPGLRAVGVAWRLGQDTGSALGAVLDRVADDLTAADTQRRAVTVALAGPRASAALVALLPVLGLGLGTAMGASPVGILSGSSAGRLLCLVGVVLDVSGVLWIRTVLRRAEQG